MRFSVLNRKVNVADAAGDADVNRMRHLFVRAVYVVPVFFFQTVRSHCADAAFCINDYSNILGQPDYSLPDSAMNLDICIR